MILKYLLPVTFVLLWCYGCSVKTNVTSADISLQFDESKVKRKSESNIKIGIPSSSPYVVPGVRKMPYIIRDPRNAMSELAIIELRNNLHGLSGVSIYNSNNAVGLNYIIRVRCTEFVINTDDKSKSLETPNLEAASIVGVLGVVVSPGSLFLGPASGVISAFEPLTGISFSSHYEEINSMLTISIDLVDTHGSVLLSDSYSASFSAKTDRKGAGTTSSSNSAFASSIAQDAVRHIVSEVSKDIQKTLRG